MSANAISWMCLGFWVLFAVVASRPVFGRMSTEDREHALIMGRKYRPDPLTGLMSVFIAFAWPLFPAYGVAWLIGKYAMGSKYRAPKEREREYEKEVERLNRHIRQLEKDTEVGDFFPERGKTKSESLSESSLARYLDSLDYH